MAQCTGPYPAAAGGTTPDTSALEARVEMVAGIAHLLGETSRAERFLRSRLEARLCGRDDPEGPSASQHGAWVDRGA